LSWESGRVDSVELVAGVSPGGFLAHVDDLVLALDVAEEAVGEAEHPPRMRRPPRTRRERTVLITRFEGSLGPPPPPALVD
jgi:hypothetical protein